jgi:hypothetical protein
VVEKFRQIASQGCNRQIVNWSEFTLSMASEIGMEDVQHSRLNTQAFRNQKAAGLSNVTADAVLKDHWFRCILCSWIPL